MNIKHLSAIGAWIAQVSVRTLGWTTGFRDSILGRSRIFVFAVVLRPSLDPFTSYSSVSGGCFVRGKMIEKWGWPPPASSAEVNNAWSVTSTPPYTFTTWRLIRHGGSFTWYCHIGLRVNFWERMV
jgi:hypothetical protein